MDKKEFTGRDSNHFEEDTDYNRTNRATNDSSDEIPMDYDTGIGGINFGRAEKDFEGGLSIEHPLTHPQNNEWTVSKYSSLTETEKKRLSKYIEENITGEAFRHPQERTMQNIREDMVNFLM